MERAVFLVGYYNNKTLICKICFSQQDKLCSMPNVSMSFISLSSNYWLSALKDHGNSAWCQCAIREKEHEEAVAVGNFLPPRKIQHRPLTSESLIVLGIQQMSEKDCETLSKITFFKPGASWLSAGATTLSCVTKTTVYSLSKPSCVRETPWCKVCQRLWKWKCM